MLKIGTRGSKLALWQAAFTQAELTRIGVESEVVIIETPNDLVSDPQFDEQEPKALSNKEIEDALLRGEVDFAVHFMKDLPTVQPEGLCITAVSGRQNPSDLLVIRKESYADKALLKLAPKAIAGASSRLRNAQLLAFRPDVLLKNVQGNVHRQLEQLRAGDFDTIFLAASEVIPLGLELSDFEIFELPAREFVPAPAQGVLAWQTNRNDTPTRLILKQLHHTNVSACTNMQRRVLQLLGGDYHRALGVYCERDAVGNYHAFAACEIAEKMCRTRFSSSTHFGMAEKLVQLLKNQ